MHRAYHPDPESRRRPIRWLALVPWLVAAYAATGVYSVGTNERAVVRRCGQALPKLQAPGLHFGLPYGIDKVSRLKPFEQKRVAVGTGLATRALGRRAEPQQAECLTGDRNLILVSAIVHYEIADPKAYLVNVAGVPTLVRNVAASALAPVISSMRVDDVLTVERAAIQNQVQRATQAVLHDCGAGVRITSVLLSESVTPPQEVAEAFRDVTSAREDRQRSINEAQADANRLMPQALGEAQRIRLEAEAAAGELTAKAQGEADRFEKVRAELSGHNSETGLVSRDGPRGASDELDRSRFLLTEKRLILETMEEVLPRLRKIVLDADASETLDLGILEAGQ